MFRHERPQSGRFRQFHQVDVEAIGSPGPAVDAEVVALLHHLLEAWGLRGVELHVNSIGDPACRPRYREAFLAYLEGQRDALCPDCHVRMTKNPLRVLDCKASGCRAVAAKAPTLSGYLCDACREHFAQVRGLLDGLQIGYEVDERLVRGLDYYTRTTFEFLNPALGAQNAVAGGGRYDGLVEELGGPPTPSHRIRHRRGADPHLPGRPNRRGRDPAHHRRVRRDGGTGGSASGHGADPGAATERTAVRAGSGGTQPEGTDAAGEQGSVPVFADIGRR